MHALMFDSNVWDEFRIRKNVLSTLRSLIDLGLLEVFVTNIQITENEGARHKEELQEYREFLKAKTLPTSGFVLDFSKLDFDALGPENSRWVEIGSKSNRDQVTGQTAELYGNLLVTEDKKTMTKFALRNDYPVTDLATLIAELSNYGQLAYANLVS